MGEVFSGKFNCTKIFNNKYEAVDSKNKADYKQSKLETQNEPLELDKEKEPKFDESIAERTELRKQKSDMPDLESKEFAAQRTINKDKD